jgi:hypothetical protein
MFRRLGLVRRPQNAEAIVVLVHELDEALGQRLNALAVLGGPLDDLVVDVGDVPHERHQITAIFQIAPHDVERHLGTRMADVAEVINRIAAYIHAHDAGLVSPQLVLATGQ